MLLDRCIVDELFGKEHVVYYLKSFVEKNLILLVKVLAVDILYRMFGKEFRYGDVCDLESVDNELCIEVRASSSSILNDIGKDEYELKKLIQIFSECSKGRFRKCMYVFIQGLEKYEIKDVEELLKQLYKCYENVELKIRELLDVKVSELLGLSSTDNEVNELEQKVVELYKKGKSIMHIAKELKLSYYKVRRILVKHGLVKIPEDVCPRCFHKLEDFGLFMKCPNCGFKKLK